MARRLKKAVDVQKFGGTEHLGKVKMRTDDSPFEGHEHEVESVEGQSKTTLEMDKGEGDAVVIRCFEFAMNPEAFHKYKAATGTGPDNQVLFNAHYKGIEVALWKDGLKVMDQVHPRIKMDTKTMRYQIFVAGRPMKGHLLSERPQTLTEIVHG